MLIYSFITDYQAFSLRYKDNTTRDKNETKVGKQSANLGKNNEPIQNRLSFLIDCKSVILHHLTILSFPMVRPAWDNWWLLDLDEDVEIVPVVPDNVPKADITYADALDRALTNNKFAKNMRRRQLEADYEVAKAKGNLREINLFLQVGYTGTDMRMGDAYTRLRGNQLAQVGFTIPLLDWGRRRGKVKVAESNRRVTQSRLRQESMNFNQELFVLVERFCNQQSQLAIATRTNAIARKRYDTNVQTYLIGKISTLDLNDSQSKKDESMRQYINELYKFWSYWYQLRSLTLFDYSTHEPINADIDKLVK